MRVPDTETCESAPVSVDQIDQGTRDHHGTEHGREDAQAQDHGKAADGAAAEEKQRYAGNQGGDIGVQDSAEGTFIACADARLGGVSIDNTPLLSTELQVSFHMFNERS